MGTSINAYIEYDKTLLYSPEAKDIQPFSTVPEAIDLTNFVLFRSGKDYRFIGALSGIRNQTNIAPLYNLRGLPSPISSEASRGLDEFFDPNDYGLGWLYLREIEAAIAHMGFMRQDLSLETNVVIEMMIYLQNQLGVDRVRMVFGIE